MFVVGWAGIVSGILKFWAKITFCHHYDEHEASRQIDLIIYDNESPIIFKERDYGITTPDSVRAIIVVKMYFIKMWLFTKYD